MNINQINTLLLWDLKHQMRTLQHWLMHMVHQVELIELSNILNLSHLLKCWEHLAHLENSIPFFMHFDIFELFLVTGVFNVKQQK